MARRPSSRSQRVLLWTLVGVVVLAGVTVVRVPRGEPAPKQVEETPVDGAAAVVGMTIDSVDAPRSVVKLRLQAVPGPAAPPSGVTVFSSVGGAPMLRVSGDKLAPEVTTEVELTSGDVADYPFDRYRTDVSFLAVAGADATVEDLSRREALPVAVQGFVTATGFDVRAEARADDAASVITIDANRTGGARGWVVAMMVVYWALAAAAFAVMVVTLLGDRAWETRHLAWLGSMIFALVAFRNAAPGSPPIGTFFDVSSFFPALAFVAASLVALVGYYLVSPRERLKL